MAKREQPKPLFAVKHDFYASLDRFANEAGLLADAVKTALDLDCIDKRVSDLIQERLAAFEAARK